MGKRLKRNEIDRVITESRKPGRPRTAPLTTLEGQTAWYAAVLDDPEVGIKEKREVMKELATLHGLYRTKDYSNLATKSNEELIEMLNEAIKTWRILKILTVVDWPETKLEGETLPPESGDSSPSP